MIQFRQGDVLASEMTLRDHFAAAALTAVLSWDDTRLWGVFGSGHRERHPLETAGYVYRMADAMLAEREKERS